MPDCTVVDEETPLKRPLDMPLLVGVALGGIALGVLSSLGALAGTLELVAWVVLGTGALIAALRRIPQDPFRHIAFGMMLAGFLAANAKILLWDQFLANHQEMVNATLDQGVDSVPRTAVILSDTITGVLFGLVFGAVAAYLARRRPASAERGE